MKLKYLVDFILSWISFFLDVLYGNNINPVRSNVLPYSLSSEMLTSARRALDDSLNVWFDVPIDNVTEVFFDANDKAMIRFREDEQACYVTFKGANGGFSDLGQSFSYSPRRVCGAEGCCFAMKGIRNAFYSDFFEDFELAVKRCHQRCAGGGCPIFLTGHSQGASVATVAAVALAKYEPKLLAFGAHPSFWFGCKVLDEMETNLRFTSTCTMRGEPFYDLISTIRLPLLTRHSGTMILLGPGGASTLAYNKELALMPGAEPCHDVRRHYIENLSHITPGPLDGFVDGSLCTRDIECKSQRCFRKRCVAKE